MTTARALLRQALDRSSLTARELALRAGMAEGRISDYLSGRYDPGASRLLNLLEAAGMDVELRPNRDGNGIILAQLLDLGQALSVSPRFRPVPEPARFRDLIGPAA